MTVLIIEDEAAIRRFLRPSLAAEGFEVLEAATGEEGLAQASARKPGILLVDLGLPDLDGLELIRRLRSWSTAPVIVLTARGREEDKVAALDAGADDYLTKPFGVGELLARVRVAQRHAEQAGRGTEEAVIRTGELTVDLAARLVRVRGVQVHLTPHEYEVLALLARRAGKVVTHKQILKAVWGQATTEQAQYVRLFIHQLRAKVEQNPARPAFILTEPGVGYRLRAEG